MFLISPGQPLATGPYNSRPRKDLRGLRGMRGLGAAGEIISPGSYPNGPYGIGQNQANLMNVQATLSPNPLDYSSPQYAIAAGLDPTTVNNAWAQALAQYPTQDAAVSAGIMAGVVTQLWAQSRQYISQPAAPNYTPMILIGLGVVILAALHVGDKGSAE